MKALRIISLAIIATLFCKCTPELIVSNDDNYSLLSELNLNRREKAEIVQEIQKRSNAKIINKDRVFNVYRFSPRITNNKKQGLYYVSNFSHRGPIYIIRGRRKINAIDFSYTPQDFPDSIRVALDKQGRGISKKMRAAIIENFATTKK